MKKILLLIAVFLIVGGFFYGAKSNISADLETNDMNLSREFVENSENREGNLDSYDFQKEQEPYIAPGFEGIPSVPNQEDEDSVTGTTEITFVGTLEEVNTACFADGECFIIVDGKKVTLLIGWSRDVVGQVKGSDGIGGLEEYIGREVEVYAISTPDGNYTLYGKETYYISPVE